MLFPGSMFRFLDAGILVVLLLMGAPTYAEEWDDDEAIVQTAKVENYSQRPSASAEKIRNVILLIGDGMGPQQIGLLLNYAHLAPGSKVPERTPAMERLMNRGNIALVRTDPYGAMVTDSAAAATQLATGERAGSEMIGLNYRGDRVDTVLEIARSQGKSTGLISDTRITHATPAAFAAHQTHRTKENEIAEDLLANQVDVMLSGGMRNWLPQAVNDKDSAAYLAAIQMNSGQFDVSSKRKDNRNLLVEARGDYQLVFDRFALQRVKKGRLLGLFANSEMYDALSEKQMMEADERTQPTLVEMTSKALSLLDQNPHGFFLMVEGGQIDWAGHNNDTGTMLHELLRFDRAVRCAFEWAAGRDDTLILVTADHETGGFGFSYSSKDIPAAQTLPGDAFDNEKFKPNFNFAAPGVLDKIYAQKKSYFQLLVLEFDGLPAEQRTPEKLMEMVNESMEFEISLEDAIDILDREPNRSYREGHRYLGSKTVPRVHDFKEFYVYGENSRMDLLGRKLAAQQNTVWSTGTHTSTPVLLISYGPSSATSRFTGLLHATDVGKRMIQVVRGE